MYTPNDKIYGKDDFPTFEGQYSPTIVKIEGSLYAISGSVWIEIDETVDIDLVKSKWIQKPKRVVNREWAISVQSGSDPNIKYNVRAREDAEGITYRCDCPGYGFSKSVPKTCKHIRQVQTMNP